MGNFSNKNLIQERYKDARTAILPNLKEALKVRDAARQHQLNLEQRIADLQAQQAEIVQTIQSLRDKSLELGRSGNDPLQVAGELQEQKTRLELIQGLIADLQTEVKAAIDKVQETQESLYDCWSAAQAEYHQTNQTAYTAELERLSQLHASYSRGVRQLYGEIMRLGDFPSLRYPRGRVPGPVTELIVERGRSIFELSRGKEWEVRSLADQMLPPV